jgi:hypothetical protein
MEEKKKLNAREKIQEKKKELEARWKKECVNCKKEIDLNAKKCEFCWRSQNVIIVVWIIFVLVFFCFIWYWFYQTDWSSPEKTKWACSYEQKEIVRNYFKSPSWVKFITCDFDNSRIWGEADAPNSFWVMLRSKFICVNWNCIIE